MATVNVDTLKQDIEWYEKQGQFSWSITSPRIASMLKHFIAYFKETNPTPKVLPAEEYEWKVEGTPIYPVERTDHITSLNKEGWEIVRYSGEEFVARRPKEKKTEVVDLSYMDSAMSAVAEAARRKNDAKDQEIKDLKNRIATFVSNKAIQDNTIQLHYQRIESLEGELVNYKNVNNILKESLAKYTKVLSRSDADILCIKDVLDRNVVLTKNTLCTENVWLWDGDEGLTPSFCRSLNIKQAVQLANALTAFATETWLKTPENKRECASCGEVFTSHIEDYYWRVCPQGTGFSGNAFKPLVPDGTKYSLKYFPNTTLPTSITNAVWTKAGPSWHKPEDPKLGVVLVNADKPDERFLARWDVRGWWVNYYTGHIITSGNSWYWTTAPQYNYK